MIVLKKTKEQIPKELWRNRWLNSINELTSIELQRKSWLDQSNTNPHWSYVEFICSYFDDLSINDNYEYQLRHNLISKEEYLVVINWHKALDEYNAPNGDYQLEDILEDEKWQDVVARGLNAKKELERLLSHAEIELLNKDIDHLDY